MPDITMCCNCNCPLREKCYRFRAVPDVCWQSFAMFMPKTSAKRMAMVVKCDHFWEVDFMSDKVLPMDVIENRYKRDAKWKGLLDEEEQSVS